MFVAHRVRADGLGDVFHLLPSLEGHSYVLITRGTAGTYVYACDPRGHPRREHGSPIILYHTDQSPQDALIDLGYSRGEGS